jgi:hypothetical protein
MTAAGNMTKSAQPSQPLSQPQIPNTTTSSALKESFQKCLMSSFNPIVRPTLNSMDIAVLEKVAIQNITGNVTGNTYGMEITIKPIIDCMKQEQQQPYQQAGSNATSSSSSNPLAKIGQALSGLFGGKNMTKSAQPSQPLSQPQIPNTIPPQYPAYQQQPYPFQPYQQQQPNNNYPLPRILSQTAYTSSTGTVHIVGEVINQSPVTAKFVKIIVTFYNAYNEVVGTDFTYTQPSDLAPGQRAPFDILVLSGGIPMNEVRNYVLTVDAS